MSAKRVAVVTGSNRGIGLATLTGLCNKFDGVVYLTSRDTEKGRAAQAELQKTGLNPRFHQLDITDRKSLQTFADYIKKKYGGLDLLVNNAGWIFFRDPYPNHEQAKYTFNVNYEGLKNVADILHPILREGARVVNMNSNWGHLSVISDKKMRDRFANRNITKKQLDDLVSDVIDDVKNGKVAKADWDRKYYEYRMSHVAIYALGSIHAKELASKKIAVFAVNPGFCQTDMTNGLGVHGPEEGCKPVLYACLEAPFEHSGKYIWLNNDVVDWYDYTIPCADLDLAKIPDPTPYPNQKVEAMLWDYTV